MKTLSITERVAIIEKKIEKAVKDRKFRFQHGVFLRPGIRAPACGCAIGAAGVGVGGAKPVPWGESGSKTVAVKAVVETELASEVELRSMECGFENFEHGGRPGSAFYRLGQRFRKKVKENPGKYSE